MKQASADDRGDGGGIQRCPSDSAGPHRIVERHLCQCVPEKMHLCLVAFGSPLIDSISTYYGR
ncbi:hypothetical protein GCM10022235_85580 [Kribbella ginsengisoli]|uniref:Uncharacterized protein n=1 Tax=Kribbella ginsengisoli TaxID=363865 RepID=A0ABP6Z7S7_9ACTN